MENRDYSSVLGSPDAPYVTWLAHRYGLATNSFAVSHPSLPNYLALIGGSTFGITSDCTTCSVDGPSLPTQLAAAHIPWRAYMEGMPSACYSGGWAGGYAKKHDPFMYFSAVVSKPDQCLHVESLSRMSSELSGRDPIPGFTWITPNLCNDGHDCSTSTADSWIKANVPSILKALRPNGVLFITWDEGYGSQGCCGSAGGGHILTIVAGPGAKAHAVDAAPVDHYSILKTIERIYGLGFLGQAACRCTNDLMALIAKR
jgi:phosphatidylinositol-3-phosphatase